MGHFDTSVIFYNLCMTRLKEDELLKRKNVGIFKKSHLTSVTYQNAKALLYDAMKEHDSTLKELGQLGLQHRCNGDPYLGKNYKSIQSLSTKLPAPSAANITNLWYYKTRKPITEKIAFRTSEAILVDKLCRGGKLQVHIYIFILPE